MYNGMRRPYYNRNENMPQTTHHEDVSSVDSRRFWHLLKNLRRRQDEAKKNTIEQQQATTS